MLQERLFATGPKRILALDGGGLRGAITLGYLKKLETILRKQNNKPDLVLSDYFDLIGGTSTGAIIAAALAIGKDVDFIIDQYRKLGATIFSQKNFVVFGDLTNTYKSGPLKDGLKNVFQDIKIGGSEIKTGLCIVTKRIDTASTWPIVNIPTGKYFDLNKNILLRDAVRASTAAPTYFIPEQFDVGLGEQAKFVDGGVSMFNNPAMQLFLVATLKGFTLNWKRGENDLLLVSIGTGFYRPSKNIDDVKNNALYWATTIPDSLMYDATMQNQLLLQFMGRCPNAISINGEVGNLSDELLAPEPLLTYLRYNVKLETADLNELGLTNFNLETLRKMDMVENYPALEKLGQLGAAKQILEEHIPQAFNLK